MKISKTVLHKKNKQKIYYRLIYFGNDKIEKRKLVFR